jgi:oxygen-independent coproporphyrinogen III oxidase
MVSLPPAFISTMSPMISSSHATPAPNTSLQFARAYESYAYTYPHKSAFGTLTPPRRLRDVWATEAGAGTPLALYMHVPFCGMRCGFCNLFTMANPKPLLTARYLDTLERQADVVAAELAAARLPQRPRRLVIGGGTPTYLAAENLARLFDLVTRVFGADAARIPSGVETSPGTASEDRLAVLAAQGVERVSIGAQSFIAAERAAMGRPQKTSQLETALDRIRAFRFPVLNIDLIYGAANQTLESWRQSLRRALMWHPEEVHLYPLYVRPQTGLGGRVETWDFHRLALYRTGREFLLGEGYEQISMRLFRRAGLCTEQDASPEFAAPDEATLGLGPGARSVTRSVHYSTEYAVQRANIIALLEAWCGADDDAFRHARHGIALTPDDRLRRYVLQTLLRVEGTDVADFTTRFGAPLLDALPSLRLLIGAALAEQTGERFRLTPAGLELSDAIGPWLYAPHIQQ